MTKKRTKALLLLIACVVAPGILLVSAAQKTAGQTVAQSLQQAAPATAPAHGVSLPVTYERAVDGDTVDFLVTFKLRGRLIGTWAPESRTTNQAEKKLGLAAKANLEKLTTGKHGTVFIPTEGARSVIDVLTMERVLIHAWVDGEKESLNARQVREGFATKEKAK